MVWGKMGIDAGVLFFRLRGFFLFWICWKLYVKVAEVRRLGRKGGKIVVWVFCDILSVSLVFFCFIC